MDARRLAGRSAIAAVGVFLIANLLWALDQPDPGAPASEIVRFYTDGADRIVVGGLLSLFSIALFAVFAAAVRAVLAETDTVLADLAFAGGLLTLAAGLGAESVNAAAAMRANDGELSNDLALALFDVSYVLGSYAAGVGAGVMCLALGLAALRDPSLLPRPVAVISLAIAAVSVVPIAAYVIGAYVIGPPFLLLAYLGARLLRIPARPADGQNS